MPVAWFVCPYVVEGDGTGWPKWRRRPAFHSLVHKISADGGQWSGAEGLGNFLVVKIRASDATLNEIAALPTVVRLPKNLLSSSLSDLSAAQRTAIVNKLEAMGYTTTEIRDSLGNNIGQKTLGDVLRFAVKRRFTPRWDDGSGKFVLDGDKRPTRSIDLVDDEVSA